MQGKNKELTFLHVLILVILSVFVFSVSESASEKDGLLKVYFFDVGQGDAIFIETPNGNQVLIDGGPDSGIINRLSEVMPFYDREIDAVILSHAHSDHLIGLFSVLERYDVRRILQTKETNRSPMLDAWEEIKTEEGAEEIEAINGTTIDLGSGVTIKILYPLESLDGKKVKNNNNSSVMIMLKYGRTEILFTGDMEIPIERKLILQKIPLDVDVLKIAHHGSDTSSSEAFLSVTSPDTAVISVGEDNRYRHPSKTVLLRLESFGIPYYRTDTDGSIKLISDGENFQIIKYDK
jgi:competence protein ComEC